jgi:hypothetical protein
VKCVDKSLVPDGAGLFLKGGEKHENHRKCGKPAV